MREDNKVVLNYLPGNTGDVRWLPGKHIDILPQEGNGRAFLFVSKGSTNGEGTTSAILPCRDFLRLRVGDLGLLADGTLRQVIVRRSALRRGTLPEVLAGVLARLLYFPCILGGSWNLCGFSYYRVAIHLVHVDNYVLLVEWDGNESNGPWHLQSIVGIVGCRHELCQSWATKDSIIGQWDFGDVEYYPLCSEVQLSAECHQQSDLSLGSAPAGVDPLERTRGFELFIKDLQFLSHSRRDQVQSGPTIN